MTKSDILKKISQHKFKITYRDGTAVIFLLEYKSPAIYYIINNISNLKNMIFTQRIYYKNKLINIEHK